MRTVTRAAVVMADEQGLDAVTMRALAKALGLASAMALYTYVPGKGELLDLMVDLCFEAFTLEGTGVRAVADANRALFRAHPWLVDVTLDRPVLGPGSLRKYELELGALEPLPDVERDLALGLIIAHARAHAAAPSTAEDAWWALAGPALARHVTPEDFPLGHRVGSATGAFDPDRAYAFGVELLERAIRTRSSGAGRPPSVSL